MKDGHLSSVTFAELPLHPSLHTAIAKLGFTHCTPIQALCLPRAMAGEDIAGQAQTGTGKSAAFLLAVLNKILTNPRKATDDGKADQPRAIILAPTRELVIQIQKDAEGLADGTGVRTTVVYGGTDYEQQRDAVAAGTDILIGTPGRLIDYFKQGVFNLKHIESIVLDEADRMFDLGFLADLRYILRRCPPATQRSNFLFSATLSHRVMELAYEHMNSPVRVEVETEQVTATRVRQAVVHVSNDQKLPMLLGLLQAHDATRTMIFINTKREADMVERTLNANEFKARTLSGDVPQRKRESLLAEFKTGELPILVATDVAARGLHIEGVTHVINYDLPQDAEDYVHRIGRTARAGTEGDAISLCCESWVYSLPEIERYIGAELPRLQNADEWMVHDYVKVAPAPRVRRSGGKPRDSSGRNSHNRKPRR